MTEDAYSNLIRTKLQPPRSLGKSLVDRPALTQHLDQNLGRKLTLFSAPAGYGKTTTAIAWLDQCRRTSTWLCLDENDDELSLFLDYFVSAIQNVSPSACHHTAGLNRAPEPPPVEFLATTCINELAEIDEPIIVVLDNYDKLQDRAIHEFMDRLITYLPATLHLVLCCRTDPPLPLSRLRAGEQLVELRAKQLRLSVSETASLLTRMLDEPVDPSLVSFLEEWTAGWVAGIRLAALSMRNHADQQSFIANVRGSEDRVLVDYLMDEVIGSQSPSVKHFLMITSFLDSFCAPLCDAMLDVAEQIMPATSRAVDNTSQQIIQHLTRSDFFVSSLDDQRGWYRYHDLMRDYLRRYLADRVDEGVVEALQRRAAVWYEECGQINEAIRSALAGNDPAFAADLVRRHRVAAINRAEWSVLERWLRLLPKAEVARHPDLLIASAVVSSTLTRNPATTAAYLRQAEEVIAEAGFSAEVQIGLQAEIAALRSIRSFMAGDHERSLSLSQQAVRDLPAIHTYQRGIAFDFQQMALQTQGEFVEACDALQAAASNSNGPVPYRTQAYIALCFVSLAAGRLHQMWQAAQHCLQMGESSEFPLAVTWASYFIGLAHYEWNELDDAATCLERVYTLRYWSSSLTVYLAMTCLTKIHLATDSYDQADERLAQYNHYALSVGNSMSISEMDLLRAELLHRRGEVASSARWRASISQATDPVPLFFYDDVQVMQTQWSPSHELDAIGRGVDELHSLLRYAVQKCGRLRQIQVLAVLALACQQAERPTDALAHLTSALEMGQSAGFKRTFVDCGPKMAHMLRLLLVEQRHPEKIKIYVREVLSAFPEPASFPSEADSVHKAWMQSQNVMVTPLTPRESEVLLLLAGNLSYREIGIRLSISLNTVKKHASHIYEKLDVNGRAEAIAKASSLEIVTYP